MSKCDMDAVRPATTMVVQPGSKFSLTTIVRMAGLAACPGIGCVPQRLDFSRTRAPPVHSAGSKVGRVTVMACAAYTSGVRFIVQALAWSGPVCLPTASEQTLRCGREASQSRLGGPS